MNTSDRLILYLEVLVTKQLHESQQEHVRKFLAQLLSDPVFNSPSFDKYWEGWYEQFAVAFLDRLSNIPIQPPSFIVTNTPTGSTGLAFDLLWGTIRDTLEDFPTYPRIEKERERPGSQYSAVNPSTLLNKRFLTRMYNRYDIFTKLDFSNSMGHIFDEALKTYRDEFKHTEYERDARKLCGETPLSNDSWREQMLTIAGSVGVEHLINLLPKTHVPPQSRFEHMHVVGATGSGKTTFLFECLLKDFSDVAQGKSSIVVMDSKRDLIKTLERLRIFAPGGLLEGKLVSIDVEDAVEFPIALNIMDLGSSDQNLSPLQKEVLRNSTLSLMNYFFHSLLKSGSELTQRQSTVFNFLIQLMVEIPSASLDTLLALLSADSLTNYQPYIKRLDVDAQQYFSSQFFEKRTHATKIELVNRIYAIKSNRTLSRMFSAPKTKINFFKELSEGKVILINCAKSVLQDEVEVFGRFMLAMILLAAERRQLTNKRKPTFVYMDEAQDILKNDTRIPTILDQARAMNVGMIIAHQRLDQMSPPVLSALMGSTAIKCASGLVGSEARHMASAMNIDVESLNATPKYHFTVSCRGHGSGQYKPVYVPFDELEYMSETDYTAFQEQNRAKYCQEHYQATQVKLQAVAEPELEDPLDDGEDFY